MRENFFRGQKKGLFLQKILDEGFRINFLYSPIEILSLHDY
jgi:hypothetical protein